MPAGRRNKRVTFQKQVETEDGGGGKSLVWGSNLRVWGRYQPERGREALEAGRLEAANLATLTILSSAAAREIDPAWRVLVDGVPHQIRSIVNPDQKGKSLEMVVERGVGT